MNIPKILEALAAKHRKKILFREKEITTQQAFAFNGGLPLLVKRANLLYDFLFGEKLQVSLRSDPEALAGDVVVVAPTQSSFILVMMLYDVFEELVTNAGKGNVVLS